MRRTWAAMAGLLVWGVTLAYGQNAVLDLYAPGFLGGGANAASTASPYADVINPAASGGTQRFTADLSYVALVGLGTTAGWGNVLNAGLTYPTPAGVITGSARFLGSTFPFLNIGNVGTVNLSFAKDLFPDLFVGAGLGFQFGSSWGLGLDLGFIHSPGDLGFLKDFRWGIAMRGIGMGYAVATPLAGNQSTLPPAFTPDVGLSFALVKTDAVNWTLAPDISFPTFQDVRFTLGTGVSILDTVFLSASYAFDLTEYGAGTLRSFPFSFGLNVKLKTKSDGSLGFLKGGDIAVDTAVAPLQNGVYGIGLESRIAVGQIDKTPPAVTLANTQPAYISPDTASTQGALSVPLTVTDERYIKGVRLIIKNADGDVVRTIEYVDNGPTSKGLANLWDRLIAVKKSVDVPAVITWDGKDNSGAKVPDGAYTYEIQSWDDNNNKATTEPLSVTVDTTPPTVTATAGYLEFSPSGQSTKGTLPIRQTGSVEDLWIGSIADESGKEVRQFRWTNQAPQNFEWDGRDSFGASAPDGTYTYSVTATDRAGNTGAATIAKIVINTQATPIGVSTDLPAFSPTGNSPKHEIRILPNLKVTAGIDSWSVVVKDTAGNAKRTFSGKTTVPTSIVFDGKDDQGTYLPEGSYRASLNVIYTNGHTPTADSPTFALKVTPPSAKVSAPYLEFSPDGVGTQTALKVQQSGTTEILWTGAVKSASGTTVRNMRWDESAPKDFPWDGRDDSGKIVPDGTYSYVVSATDAAGNTGSATLAGIIVNTTPTPVSLSIDNSAFSPNGDGVQDTLKLAPAVPVSKGIVKWSIGVKDKAGQVRRSFSGGASAPPLTTFDGKDDDGVLLPQGTYTATLAVTYSNGHNPNADSAPFTLDVTAPTATVTSDFTVFSPVGEGARNTLVFSQSVSKDAQWTGTVSDAAGTAVRSVKWSGRPDAKFVFDGHGDSGQLLADGAYTYTLSGIDKAGNSGKSGPVAFQIDTRATTVILSTDLPAFSPNADGVKDTIKIIPSLKVNTDVVSYELRILDSANKVVRLFTAKATAPGQTIWDGSDNSGVKAPDGQYVAELEVVYANGSHPVARTSPFLLKTTAPTISVSTDYLMFAPTADSSLQSIVIHQTSSVENQWQGQIVDSTGKAVRTYTWDGKAADFSWDGKDDNGNLVPDGTYKYVVSTTDIAGNTGTVSVSGIVVDTRPTPVSVSARTDGFSPNGDGVRDNMSFSLSIGLGQGITSWKLSMIDSTGKAQKTFTGSGTVPDSMSWDGKADSGQVAPNGMYAAQLDVAYAKGNRPTAKSDPFLLSVAPPNVTLDAGPLPFSPDGDGYNDVLTITPSVTDPSPIDTWDVTVLDPMDHFFINWSGKGALPAPFTWNGLSSYGELVQSADDYTLVATVKDQLGNAAVVKKTIPIDVLVMRQGDKLLIRISSITFKENTADYTNVPDDRAQANQRALGRLADIFKRYSQYKIEIDGYAVMVYWDDPVKGAAEQKNELIPLSKARADAIKGALVKLGIDANRVTTVGYGGVNPIAPFGDLENRWKDRRVEFVLVR